MFNHGSIPLFNFFGLQIKLDPSWVFLAGLIIWTLSTGWFPMTYPGMKEYTYLWMGLWVVVGLFASIVLHEFAHSWVAQRFGLPMHGITLFIFGGVSEMEKDSPNPKTECLMALAGPAASILILLVFTGLAVWGRVQGWSLSIVGVLSYLASLNGMLAVFNMVPAFPLDGGRVLRSALWAWKKNLKWATHITSRLGGWFGGLLVFLGILSILQGEFIGGIWWVIIGIFLRQAAKISYEQVLLRKQLEGQPIQRFMQSDVIAVNPELTLQELVDEFFYRFYFNGFPVVKEHQLLGYISLEQIQNFSSDRWPQTKVAEVMNPLDSNNSTSVQSDAMDAFFQMSKTGQSQLMVISDDKRLLGLLSLKDLQQFSALKTTLEE